MDEQIREPSGDSLWFWVWQTWPVTVAATCFSLGILASLYLEQEVWTSTPTFPLPLPLLAATASQPWSHGGKGASWVPRPWASGRKTVPVLALLRALLSVTQRQSEVAHGLGLD